MKNLSALALVMISALTSAHSAQAFSFSRKEDCNREVCARREAALELVPLLGGGATVVSAIVLARDAHRNQRGSFRKEFFPLFGGAFGFYTGSFFSRKPYTLVDGPGEVKDFATEDEAEMFRSEAKADGLRLMGAYTVLMGTSFFLATESKNRAIIAAAAAIPIGYTLVRLLSFEPYRPAVRDQSKSSAIQIVPTLFYSGDRILPGGLFSMSF